MKYNDLRDFIAQLEELGELKRITQPISTHLTMTEISDRTLRAGGPALLFENPIGSTIPVLTNLFGTPKRVALAMGQTNVEALREVGKLLALLKEPEPPKGFRDALDKLPVYKQVLNMPAKSVKKANCQQEVFTGDEVDLTKLPIQHCWPGDVAPFITWGLTVTKGPHKERQNLGIYRQQLLGPNKLIMRWLSHRGGALDFYEFKKQFPGEKYPVSVALGADPATILGAVTPVPDSYLNMPLPVYYAVAKLKSLNVSVMTYKFRLRQKLFLKVISTQTKLHLKALMVIIPVITTKWITSLFLP